MSKVLLQIFSGTVVGPIFFEFIQRKGDEGFGEGNFRAVRVDRGRPDPPAGCSTRKRPEISGARRRRGTPR